VFTISTSTSPPTSNRETNKTNGARAGLVWCRTTRKGVASSRPAGRPVEDDVRPCGVLGPAGRVAGRVNGSALMLPP
jgi:hypothetical protein